MEKRKYYTLIRKDHKLGDNVYVHGVVSGIRFMICEYEGHIPHGIGKLENGMMLISECSPEDYELFTKKVEEFYPGLCIFDYQMKESN